MCRTHVLHARDVELLNAEEYTDLAAQAREVKRMPTGLLQKLTADRSSLTAAR